MEMQLSGLELLGRLQTKTIVNNSIIRVLKKDNIFKPVCYIIWKDGEIEWKEKTFRVSMLIDNDYIFEVIDMEPLNKLLEEKYHLKDNDIRLINKYLYEFVFNI